MRTAVYRQTHGVREASKEGSVEYFPVMAIKADFQTALMELRQPIQFDQLLIRIASAAEVYYHPLARDETGSPV